MNTFMKITKIVLNMIMTIICILGIVFIGLFLYGIQPYVVESGSMEPVIQTGSVSFINKRIDYNDVKIGDIIAFKIDTGAFATHRVVEMSESGIVTKGDANRNVDSVITTKDNYVGKNIFTVSKIGWIIKKVQTTSGKIILGTIIIALFIAGILIGEPSKKTKKK